MCNPCCYILTNKKNGTLYVGSSDYLERRIIEHKNKNHIDGFTAKYNINMLVYYEKHITLGDARKRELQIKKWNRQWKINLIEKHNPEWIDLSEEILGKKDHIWIMEQLSGKKK